MRSLPRLFLLLVILVPFFGVLWGAFAVSAPHWDHVSTQVVEYGTNTLALVLGVWLGTMILGSVPAYALSRLDLRSGTILSGVLVLPLAFAPYIHAALMAHPGPWYHLDAYSASVFALSFALAPYSFLTTRAALAHQPAQLYNAAALLGRGPWARFFRVTVPLASPGLLGGMALVAMEVVSDFGAVSIMGYRSLSVGLFRSWHGLGDMASALRVGLTGLVLVLALLTIERVTQGRAKRFHSQGDSLMPVRPSLGAELALVPLLLVPAVVGFFFPLTQLMTLALPQLSADLLGRSLALVGNSMAIGVLAALVVVATALVIALGEHPLGKKSRSRWLGRLAGAGYSVPGVVIATGLLALVSFNRQALGGILVLGPSVALIVWAMTTRFFSLAHRPLADGLKAIPPQLVEAGALSGRGPLSRALRIQLPLIKSAVGSAFLLGSLEVIKELPATMLLRPFDFETLATRSYALASDERLGEAALPAFLLVILALIPVLIVYGRPRRSTPKKEISND